MFCPLKALAISVTIDRNLKLNTDMLRPFNGERCNWLVGKGKIGCKAAKDLFQAQITEGSLTGQCCSISLGNSLSNLW